jgi:lysophospholipase L1-like esterase
MAKINKLLAFGDSWTYGSELRDPALTDYQGDYDGRNDAYRLQHSWPSRLAQLLEVPTVENRGTAARSNDTILRDLSSWLAAEGYLQGRSAADLLICIGWTSPERKDFYFHDSHRPNCSDDGWVTMYPMWTHKYKHKAIDQFTQQYVRYWWNAAEYMHRYINQVHQAQTLLQSLNIRHVMFQAIYHHHATLIEEWNDSVYLSQHAQGITDADRLIWSCVDKQRFMHKDQPLATFHNWILEAVAWDKHRVLNTSHPNEHGHQLWAAHMQSWLRDREA